MIILALNEQMTYAMLLDEFMMETRRLKTVK